MAGQTIQMELLLKSNISKTTAEAKVLNKELDKAQRTASQTSAVQKAPRKVSAAAAPDSGLTRGSTGVGGGNDSKDFARQAQGLGGLVHVYATFAANIFAVTAAFTALSKAADYTNMVKGLDQLGAASGRNLGTMALNMKRLTDGAVSLKEAMAATAQGSAAGLSGEQMTRMALAAKSASQALGRDMGDSLNRLSRGITKIEPELLDELGIFVRVDRAAREYARTIGKTAVNLTDFERRQAFATAVLDQADKKFAAVKLDANPFSKLQGSFIDLLYLGGELINKVLGPIAKLLGESPAALGTVMAGIGAMLVNKAIPALSQWREGLAQTAVDAEQKAKRISESFRDFQIGKSLDVERGHLESSDSSRANALKIAQENNLFGKSSQTIYALAGGTQDLGNAAAQTDKKITSLTASIAKERAAQAALSTTDIQAMAINKQAIAQLEQKQQQYIELAASIKNARTEQQLANAAGEAAEGAKAGFEENTRARIANRATRNAGVSRINANVISNTEQFGALHAWQQVSADIAKHNTANAEAQIGKIRGAFLHAGAAARIAANSVMMVANAFSIIGIAAMLAVGAFTLVDTWLSENSKHTEELGQNLDTVKTSVEGLNRTTDLIANKDPFEKMSVESIQAIANATLELSNSMGAVAKSLAETAKYASWWDEFIDGWKTVVGADVKSKTINATSINISELIANSIDGPEKQELQDKLADILGTADFSKSSVAQALKLFEGSKLIGKIEEISKAEDKFSKKISNSASRLTAYKESLITTEKTMQDMINSFTPTDHMSKFGIAQMEQAQKLGLAIKDPMHALTALSDAVDNVDILKLYPPEVANQLLAYKTDLTNLRKSVGDYSTAIVNLQKEMQNMPQTESVVDAYGNVEQIESEAFARAKTVMASLEGDRAKLLTQVKDITVQLNGTTLSTYEAGVKKVEASWRNMTGKASLDLQKTLLSAFTGGPGMADINTDLQKQEISLQQELIKVQTAAIIEQQKLALVTEKLSIVLEQKNLGDKISKGEGSQADFDKLKSLGEAYTSNQAKQGVFSGSNTDIINRIKGLKGKGSSATEQDTNNAAYMQLSGIYTQLGSSNAQLGALAKQKTGVEVKGTVDNIAAEYKFKQDGLKIENESLKVQEKYYDNLVSTMGVTSEVIEAERMKLATKVEQNLLSIAEADIDKARVSNAVILAAMEKELGASHEKVVKARESGTKAIGRMEQDLANTRKVSDQDSLKRTYDSNKRLLDLKKESNEVIQAEVTASIALADISDTLLNISASQALINRNNLATAQLRIKGAEELAQLELTRSLIKPGEGSEEANNALDDQIKRKTRINELSQTVLKLQNDYQIALVATEDTLRSIEKLGMKTPGEYFGALADDFNNKLGQMIKAAKSAGDTFNQGLINAMDTTIDKFFDAMQKSELNFKDMVKFARNALSDVFRDTASQLAKNTWKDMLKGIMGPSKIEQAAEEADKLRTDLENSMKSAAEKTAAETEKTAVQTKLTADNTKIIADKLAGKSAAPEEKPKGSGESFGYTDDASEKYASSSNMLYQGVNNDPSSVAYENESDKASDAASTQKSAALTQSDTASFTSKAMTGIVGDLAKVAAGEMSAAQLFKNTVTNLGPLLQSFVSGLWGAIQGLSAGGGGSSGGGIFGTLIKAGISAFTGGGDILGSIGASAQLGTAVTVGGSNAFGYYMAKGGAFNGSPSLSAYSNSIVSSPTMFAFAKGGAPNRGLMGEAGPEAIIPLKRDSKGNLGVSGGGSNTNNIEINITIEQGQAKQQGSSGGDAGSMAGQLGNIIKSVVNQELIKQSRPGGLLAR